MAAPRRGDAKDDGVDPPPLRVGRGTVVRPRREPGAAGWRVVRAVGRGTFGAVFLARPHRPWALGGIPGSDSGGDTGSDSDAEAEGEDAVAIKVALEAGPAPSALLEAALLQLDPMPHVIHADRVFFGAADRRVCIVMPFMRGGCARRASEGAAPGAAGVRALLRACLRGLAELHARGIAHRDVKPGNILLARPGDWGSAVIADLGSAQLSLGCVRPRVNAAEDHFCTRQFRPPENALSRRAPYAPSGDIWSLAMSVESVVHGGRAPPWPTRGSLAAARGGIVAGLRARLGGDGAADLLALLERMLSLCAQDRPSARDALADPSLAAT